MTLLFCGLLSYWPNEDAVRFFVDSIFPDIRRQLPSVRLVIIGRGPSEQVRALADGTSIKLEADVPSVADYYRRATMGIVPLRIGGGTRIKILEAWALGVPVVSTSIGCEGLDGMNGEHFIVADTPQDFTKACVDLFRSSSLREHLVQRGRELAFSKYRWEMSTKKAVSAVQDLLNLSATEAGTSWSSPVPRATP
jgi:polysaccharide biosynthesis protein PslH